MLLFRFYINYTSSFLHVYRVKCRNPTKQLLKEKMLFFLKPQKFRQGGRAPQSLTLATAQNIYI